MIELDVVVPVYNEQLEVVNGTIDKIRMAFLHNPNYKIIIVNDGSDLQFNIDVLKNNPNITYLKHDVNQGYGRALKTGILSGSAPLIAITDADGTYPVEELPELAKKMVEADMVVGTRKGDVREVPLLRRVPKNFLNILASYMAGAKITDLNSGLRLFSRDLCYTFWGLLPRRFSFTSTLTMAAYIGGYRVVEHPINYYKRQGISSIRPINDTLRFINIIIRMGILFHPMKLFAPLALILFVVGFIKGFIRDFLLLGYIGNFSVMLILASIQIILMGYIAELIVTNRRLTLEKKKVSE